MKDQSSQRGQCNEVPGDVESKRHKLQPTVPTGTVRAEFQDDLTGHAIEVEDHKVDNHLAIGQGVQVCGFTQHPRVNGEVGRVMGYTTEPEGMRTTFRCCGRANASI